MDEDDWATLLVGERHERIRGALEPYRGRGSLYVEPTIPATKLANARVAARVPETERVLALIDCTVFGSARNCVVFGEHALYVHNGSTVERAHRGAHRFDYVALASVVLGKHGTEVRWSGGAIELSGSGLSAEEMLALLTNLQHHIRVGRALHHRPDAGVYLASHLIERGTLVSTNDHWPSGIATFADASEVKPPLIERWVLGATSAMHAPAIVRDFVILVVRTASTISLAGLELTTGKQYWRRDLPLVHWSRPVATRDVVLVKGGAYWHGFEIETGEPRPVIGAQLSREVRDQLVLVDAPIGTPASYARFADELAFPIGVDASPPPLRAADSQRRIYAPAGVHEQAPAVRIVDPRGIHLVRGEQRGELASLALAGPLVIAGTRDRRLWVADAAADPPAWTLERVLSDVPEHVSVGSDHVVVAGSSVVRCYRSS